MFNIQDKIDGASTLPAFEFNSMKNEVEHIITDGGLTLTGSDSRQLSKSMSNFATVGDYYSDLGAANTYVLSASKKAPTFYRTGMRVRFIANNTNTGASTVNVNNLGVVNITLSSGVPLYPNAILQNHMYELYHNGTSFVLLDKYVVLNTRAYLSGDMAVSAMPPANVQVKPSVIPDNLGACYDAGTGRFTPKVNGFYSVTFSAKAHVNGLLAYVGLYIAKNSGIRVAAQDIFYVTSGVDATTATTTLVYLLSTDYIAFFADTTTGSGAVLKQDVDTFISVTLVRPY